MSKVAVESSSVSKERQWVQCAAGDSAWSPKRSLHGAGNWSLDYIGASKKCQNHLITAKKSGTQIEGPAWVRENSLPCPLLPLVWCIVCATLCWKYRICFYILQGLWLRDFLEFQKRMLRLWKTMGAFEVGLNTFCIMIWLWAIRARKWNVLFWIGITLVGSYIWMLRHSIIWKD